MCVHANIHTMCMCLYYTLASNISCLFVTLKYKTRQWLYTHGHPHKIYQYVYMNTFSTTVPVARTLIRSCSFANLPWPAGEVSRGRILTIGPKTTLRQRSSIRIGKGRHRHGYDTQNTYQTMYIERGTCVNTSFMIHAYEFFFNTSM